MESKLNTPFPHSPSSFSLQQHREQGQQSVHYVLSLPLLHGHSFRVECPCPTWGTSHQMPSFPNSFHIGFPQAVALQALLQHGSVPQGPSIRRCSTQVPMDSSSLSPPAPSWAPVHGLQLQPRTLVGYLHGLQLLQVSSTAAPWPPPWLHEEICSMWCP